eukprot:PhM_4_TR5361/c1_g1_i1/m.29102
MSSSSSSQPPPPPVSDDIEVFSVTPQHHHQQHNRSRRSTILSTDTNTEGSTPTTPGRIPAMVASWVRGCDAGSSPATPGAVPVAAPPFSTVLSNDNVLEDSSDVKTVSSAASSRKHSVQSASVSSAQRPPATPNLPLPSMPWCRTAHDPSIAMILSIPSQSRVDVSLRRDESVPEAGNEGEPQPAAWSTDLPQRNPLPFAFVEVVSIYARFIAPAGTPVDTLTGGVLHCLTLALNFIGALYLALAVQPTSIPAIVAICVTLCYSGVALAYVLLRQAKKKRRSIAFRPRRASVTGDPGTLSADGEGLIVVESRWRSYTVLCLMAMCVVTALTYVPAAAVLTMAIVVAVSIQMQVVRHFWLVALISAVPVVVLVAADVTDALPTNDAHASSPAGVALIFYDIFNIVAVVLLFRFSRDLLCFERERLVASLHSMAEVAACIDTMELGRAQKALEATRAEGLAFDTALMSMYDMCVTMRQYSSFLPDYLFKGTNRPSSDADTTSILSSTHNPLIASVSNDSSLDESSGSSVRHSALLHIVDSFRELRTSQQDGRQPETPLLGDAASSMSVLTSPKVNRWEVRNAFVMCVETQLPTDVPTSPQVLRSVSLSSMRSAARETAPRSHENTFLQEVTSVTKKYRGDIHSYRNGSFIVVWQGPKEGRKVLRCAQELATVFSVGQANLPVSIGIDASLCRTGTVGSLNMMFVELCGPAVERAQGLSYLASVVGVPILCGDGLYYAADDVAASLRWVGYFSAPRNAVAHLRFSTDDEGAHRMYDVPASASILAGDASVSPRQDMASAPSLLVTTGSSSGSSPVVTPMQQPAQPPLEASQYDLQLYCPPTTSMDSATPVNRQQSRRAYSAASGNFETFEAAVCYVCACMDHGRDQTASSSSSSDEMSLRKCAVMALSRHLLRQPSDAMARYYLDNVLREAATVVDSPADSSVVSGHLGVMPVSMLLSTNMMRSMTPGSVPSSPNSRGGGGGGGGGSSQLLQTQGSTSAPSIDPSDGVTLPPPSPTRRS